MLRNELIEKLETLLKEGKMGVSAGYVLHKVEKLLKEIKKEPIRNKNYSSSKKSIRKKSQAGQILLYLQTKKNLEVGGTLFMNNSIFNNAPFIGYSATARLSELKRYGLVEIVGKVKGVKKFFYKSKDRNLYKITEKGLNYNLR